MRAIMFSAAVLLAAAAAAPSFAASSGSQSGSQGGSQSGSQSGGSSSGQQQSRQAKCDEERKACYAGKTQIGPNGERYVPPDAVSECEGGYRMCVSGGH